MEHIIINIDINAVENVIKSIISEMDTKANKIPTAQMHWLAIFIDIKTSGGKKQHQTFTQIIMNI